MLVRIKTLLRAKNAQNQDGPGIATHIYLYNGG